MFLGLIGGRELALRIKQQTSDLPFTNREAGSLAKVICTDLWKAAFGVLVSAVIALSIQPLAQLTAG